MTTTYRDRDDTRSYASTTRRDDGDRYTKVTRYIIREDDDTRSNHTSRRRDSPERETIRITRRSEVDDRETVASPRRSVAPTLVEKDLVIRSSNTEEPRSPRPWERREDTTDRELVIRRTGERDDAYRRETDRDNMTVTRVDDRRETDRYDYDVYRTGDYGRDRDLQRYTRTAEYYGAPTQPQTIIIRQDPIIIRERVRDDDYQLVRRNEEDERSVATTRRDVRDDRDDRDDRDEEFFYEKRVRERFDGPPNDEYDRRSRRELSPGDSISQVGARGRQSGSYSDDDSVVYVKRVERDSYSRNSSRDNKKDLAAGVIAGVGAAELLRNHKKKEGKETSSGLGRVGRDVGAGAIGAIAAEGIRRYRSKSRHRSRSRSDSGDRSSRRDRRERSRSRSRSGSRPNLKTLGALGLGAVAVAAAASLATRKMNENKEAGNRDRRSRSRSRRRGASRGSVQSLESLENDPNAKDARNPSHRNSRIAAAGAVGAAGAALIERARSKSRGGDGSRERSQSRVRQGLPIAVAGLGTAALAGLYEKNKAKKEAEVIQKKQRARSRSSNRRSERSESNYDDRSRGVDPSLVEYGYGDVAGNNYGPEYYGRAPPQEPYYNNTGAMVPAGRTRSRSRSVSRDRRGMRSRSASADHKRIAEGAAAAGGGAAAIEYERRKAEKRERKARKQAQEAGRDPYEEAYPPQQTPQPPWTPPPADPYASYQGFGGPQNQSQFPPPPGSMPAALPPQFQPQYQQAPAPTPNPVAAGRYTPQGAYTPQPGYAPQTYVPPAPEPPQGGPPPHQGYGEPYAAGAVPPYGQQPRNRGPDENVSAGDPSSQYTPPSTDQHPLDGVSNARSLDPAPIPPPPPTPAIQIHPPTGSSTPSLFIPNSYVPPADRPADVPSTDQVNTKSVSFAPSPETSRALDPESAPRERSDAQDSGSVSPDTRRQRRRRSDASRGYEAGDDTDLSPNTERRASKIGSNRDQSYDRAPSSGSRRERNSERAIDTGDDNNDRRERRRERRTSRSEPPPDRDHSPADSDATIDLPARFDDKGRKKTERGEDPIADKIDDMLQGRGSAGKIFGNVLDGIFGRDSQPRSVGDGERDSSRRGRDRGRGRD